MEFLDLEFLASNRNIIARAIESLRNALSLPLEKFISALA